MSEKIECCACEVVEITRDNPHGRAGGCPGEVEDEERALAEGWNHTELGWVCPVAAVQDAQFAEDTSEIEGGVGLGAVADLLGLKRGEREPSYAMEEEDLFTEEDKKARMRDNWRRGRVTRRPR